MKRLGQLLLEQKLVQPAQLEEALEAQVVHGGRLGTNLVELGFLKETDLARMLGVQHNLPFSSGMMVPDPAALALVNARFYDDADVLPMRIDATRLTVAVLGPHQTKALDALGFKAGKRVVAVVIPEFRMNQLQRIHSKAFRPIRPIDVEELRPSKKTGEANTSPGHAGSGELMNEDDFAKLYAKAAGGGLDEEIIEGDAIEEQAGVLGPPPLPSAPHPTAVLESQAPPLSFAEAQKQLQSSIDRDDIARTVLQFARSKFRRALLLNVQGELLSGWKGMGQGVTVRGVRRIGITLREQSTFKLVAGLKSHFIGPMARTPGTTAFYEFLGGGYPQTAVLLPLLVREKLVHVLYVDHGPQQLTPPDLGELLIISQNVTRSYEALIRRRKM